MTSHNPYRERALITTSNGKRPYGAKLIFQVAHAASIGDLENVSVLLPSGAIATIQPVSSAPWEGGRKFKVDLDGFPTATLAETEGLRLAQSILLVATSLNFGLRLVYHGRLPASVYERFRSQDMFGQAYATTGWPASIVLDELVSAFQGKLLDPTLTLSMELYCSALLETNERARFVTVVSALEPLAKQEALGAGVADFVDLTLSHLATAGGMEPHLRASVRGRVEQLRRESVRQALFRLADTWFPGRSDLRRQVDHAYGLRSELLHDGRLSDADADLSVETNKIANVLRSIYAQSSGQPFRSPIAI